MSRLPKFNIRLGDETQEGYVKNKLLKEGFNPQLLDPRTISVQLSTALERGPFVKVCRNIFHTDSQSIAVFDRIVTGKQQLRIESFL